MSTDALNQEAVSARTTKIPGSLPHERVATYLKAHGWTDAGPYGPCARVYSLGKGASITEIVVPTTNDVADYSWRMQDIVQTLARLEKRDVTSVCSDLLLQKDAVGALPRPKETLETKQEIAHAIKSCLDDIMSDATRCDLDDLARFISLAALAAEEAAAAHDPKAARLRQLMSGDAGKC